MERGMRRPLLSALALVASGALLAGCFTVEATFTIKDDATADIDYLLLIDTERLQGLAELFGEDAGDLDDLSSDAILEEFVGDDDPCGGLAEELAEYEITTREINEDGTVGAGCTISDVPIAELDSLGDDTSSFSIEQDADGTRFSAVLEGVDEITGDPAETEPMLAMLGIDLDELFTITFTVTAPGSLGENNASSTSGSTATWDVRPDSDFVVDGDATMSAVWTSGGDDDSSWWIIVAVLAALVAAALVALLVLKRSRGSSGSATDASPDRPAEDIVVAGGPDAAPPPPPTAPEQTSPPTSSPSPAPPPPPPPAGSSELPPPN